VLIGDPRGVDHGNVHTRKQHGRRPDQRVMRSGKAEYAVTATGMVGGLGRRCRYALGIVEAKLETRHGQIGMRGKRKSAERDQQGLRGNGIDDDAADQRSPELLYAKSEHAAPITPAAIIGNGKSKVNVRDTANSPVTSAA